jgi:type IV pilus assembly protein PilY1
MLRTTIFHCLHGLRALARGGVLLGFGLALWTFAVRADSVLGPSPETAVPVNTAAGAKPRVMLTMARDHTLFFPAYNDLSDIDGDGIIDYRFKPAFRYVGLYDSTLCYQYDTSKKFFYPSSVPGSASVLDITQPCFRKGGIAPNTQFWAGNFLNYITSTRMDVLRVALYGGYRETDTAALTVLRRAYIPQDGHAWAKTYTSIAVDGYDIGTFTPLTTPESGKHFFGNLTSTVDDRITNSWNGTDYPDPGISCAILNECSDYPPLMRVITNSPNRVWQWASAERPVLNAIANPRNSAGVIVGQGYGGGTLTDYRVRVASCAPGFNQRQGCKEYPGANGNKSYKPTGLLHDYGADGSMYFGLLTGSYDTNLSGGRLRKNIGSFTDELDASTGVFTNPLNSIITQINKIRIRNFNNNDRVQTDQNSTYYTDNFIYKNKFQYANDAVVDGNYGDWGNPVGEMMYETLRYFANQGKTSAYNGTTTEDTAVGLQTPDWTDPYADTAAWCAKPAQIVISGSNPSFDSDQLPGSKFQSGAFTDTLTGSNNNALDVKALANSIGQTEGVNGSDRFVGASYSNGSLVADGSPTLKRIDGLGEIRGLAPDDTNKEGSYYAAAVAYFGKQGNLRRIDNNTIPTVDTFALLMNSPFPALEVPFAGGKKITLVPFAKTIYESSGGVQTIFPDKANFQPTNNIVGIYIDTLTDPTNANGQYYIKLRVNYDDRAWGGDFEMDAVVIYEISAGKNGQNDDQLTVTVTPEYQSGAAHQRFGYVIAGSNHDGAYLVAFDEPDANGYYLDAPAGRWANECDPVVTGCNQLPGISSIYGAFSQKIFSPSGTLGNNTLKSPLWYAAQWGGYPDGVPPTTATVAEPSHYAQVASPAAFKGALDRAFQGVIDANSTVGSVTSDSQQLQTSTQLYTTSFIHRKFSGKLVATQFGVSQGVQGDTIIYNEKWSTSSTLTSANYASRRVFFKNSNSTTLGPFTKVNVRSINPELNVDARVNYILGDDSKEIKNGSFYRNRATTLGTIINSTPFFSSDTATVYVNANDGMLHAFDSTNGREKFAYVPTDTLGKFSFNSLTTDPHKYLVDGNIAVSNKYTSGGVNYLVAFMGRGAKGMFGLQVDASDGGVNIDSGAWENFGNGDNDMGYLLGKPLIEQLANGTNVVIFGNGYNSVNNQSVLYVARLSDGVVIKKYLTGRGSDQTPNGMATPGVVRSDGKVQYVYAGDFLGNVWKFDLRTLTGAVEAAGSGTQIYVAQDDQQPPQAQPITGQITTSYSYDSSDPLVANKRFLFFGTGSELTSTHAASSQVQAIYGLIDAGSYPISNTKGGATGLQQRTIDSTGTYADYRTGTVNVRSFSQPQANDMQDKSGWYMNWISSGNSASERVFGASVIRPGTTPTLVVSTVKRNATDCAVSGTGFVNTMDAYHGGGLTQSYVDLRRNGNFADDTFTSGASTKVIGSIDFGLGGIGQSGFSGNNLIIQGSGSSGGGGASGNIADAGTKKFTKVSRRISWREIVK